MHLNNYHQKNNYLPDEFLFGEEIEIDQAELNKLLKKNKFDPGYQSTRPAAQVISDAGSNAPSYNSRTGFSTRPKT
jgi:hypothetical protein